MYSNSFYIELRCFKLLESDTIQKLFSIEGVPEEKLQVTSDKLLDSPSKLPYISL